MKRNKLKPLVAAALCAALTAAATLVVRIPAPVTGYVNLGDCMVLLSAWLLGPFAGAAAAGVGSALADLIGYPLYAPGTLIIKALMALAAGFVFRRGRNRVPLRCAGALAAEIIMVAGYFAYEFLLLGSAPGAAAGIPANLVQAAFGLAAAMILIPVLDRANIRPIPRP